MSQVVCSGSTHTDRVDAIVSSPAYVAHLLGEDGGSEFPLAVTGKAVSVCGDEPSVSGAVIATTDGVWYYAPDGELEKLEVTGAPLAVSGAFPYDHGYSVATSDGYWVGNPDRDTLFRVGGTEGSIEGSITCIAGDCPTEYEHGSAVGTTEGYWLVEHDGLFKKVEGVTGEVLEIAGEDPVFQGAFVATTDGFWIVVYDEGAIPVEGITGDVITVSGDFPATCFVVATTDGVWVVEHDGVAKKTEEVTETILDVLFLT